MKNKIVIWRLRSWSIAVELYNRNLRDKVIEVWFVTWNWVRYPHINVSYPYAKISKLRLQKIRVMDLRAAYNFLIITVSGLEYKSCRGRTQVLISNQYSNQPTNLPSSLSSPPTTGSYYVVQGGLKFVMLWPKCYDYKCVPPCLAVTFF
jgi:hypothetical protein